MFLMIVPISYFLENDKIDQNEFILIEKIDKS